MSQPIGQTRLLNILNKYDVLTLPKTLLFIGDKGCGKKTFAKYLADKFQFDFVEIEESVKAEDIQDFTHSTINTIYLINLDNFTEKQQQAFLKFIEEPSKSVYVILTTSAEATALPTILNRCIKHHFDSYTLEELREITGGTNINPTAVEIFKTPGKLMNLTDASFKTMLDLADKLIKNIHLANYANTLSISTKINYKDLYNKVDFNLFFDAIEYLAFEDFKNNDNKQSFIIFKITNQFKQYATQSNLIKETLMLNYLTMLWEAVHDAS
jgi:DNA polymerase III delta prime subunit